MGSKRTTSIKIPKSLIIYRQNKFKKNWIEKFFLKTKKLDEIKEFKLKLKSFSMWKKVWKPSQN